MVKVVDCLSVRWVVKVADCLSVGWVDKFVDCLFVGWVVKVVDCLSVGWVVKVVDCVSLTQLWLTSRYGLERFRVVDSLWTYLFLISLIVTVLRLAKLV